MDTALIVTSGESYMEIKRILASSSVISDCAKTLREARMALCDLPYTLLVIDNPLSDGSAREFAIESSRRDELDIILLVNPAIAERVAIGLEKYGIYVIAKPVTESEFTVMIRNIRVARRKLEDIRSRCRKLNRRLEEERRLTKAKCLLALNEGMEEEEGHRYLEKKAMDCRITLLDAASEVIVKYSKN